MVYSDVSNLGLCIMSFLHQKRSHKWPFTSDDLCALSLIKALVAFFLYRPSVNGWNNYPFDRNRVEILGQFHIHVTKVVNLRIGDKIRLNNVLFYAVKLQYLYYLGGGGGLFGYYLNQICVIKGLLVFLWRSYIKV